MVEYTLNNGGIGGASEAIQMWLLFSLYFVYMQFCLSLSPSLYSLGRFIKLFSFNNNFSPSLDPTCYFLKCTLQCF